MKTRFHSERGQALILLTLGIVGLIAMTALAIDGGNAFLDRRQAQNAADSAALAAALAKIDEGNVSLAAMNIASSNGYDNNLVSNTVEVHNPPVSGPYASVPNSHEYIQVIITSHVATSFANIVGITQTTNVVEAVAHAKPETTGALFDGNAVVGLDPSNISFDAWGTSEWYIEGGGVFANYDARKKNNKDNVHFLSGQCVTVVHSAINFNCSPIQHGDAYEYPDEIAPLLPRIPACNGTAYRGGDGKLHPQAGADGSRVDHFEDTYAPGLYCITNADGNIHGLISGTNVTFYIADTSFTMKFNGGGGMEIQAPTSGEYAGVLMFSGIVSPPCSQNMEFRGNGSALNVGTVFMPSACIDARGNSDPHSTRSQIIGYNVTSNGTGDVYLTYQLDDNYKIPTPPMIELAQ